MSSAMDFQWEAAGIARLGGTHGLEMPYKGWSEWLSIQPDTCWGGIWAGIWGLAFNPASHTLGRNLGWNLRFCMDNSDANKLRALARGLASSALCGLCVSLFPSAENDSIIKAVRCLREGAAVLPEGADREEGMKRCHTHTQSSGEGQRQAGDEAQHPQGPLAQGKGNQRRNKGWNRQEHFKGHCQ